MIQMVYTKLWKAIIQICACCSNSNSDVNYRNGELSTIYRMVRYLSADGAYRHEELLPLYRMVGRLSANGAYRQG